MHTATIIPLRKLNPALLANPRRRSRRSSHRRRRNPLALLRYRRNPADPLESTGLTTGVGIMDLAGLTAGAVAAQEVPIMLNADGWQGIGAAAGTAVIGGFVGKSILGHAFGQNFVGGGLLIAALRALAKVTDGRFGLVAGSPQMHLVTGPASAQAIRRSLPPPAATAPPVGRPGARIAGW